MLDELELPLVQEINTLERRVLAEHKPPGMAGSLLQNLGRRPFRVALWGVAAGTVAPEMEARVFIEKLDGKYREGSPLPFAADIVADARLEKVVIEDLRVQELAGKPERFAYVVTLREYIEPVEPEDASLVDTDALADAQSLVDEFVAALGPGMEFVASLEQFATSMGDFLRRFEEFRNIVSGAGTG
ncbi:MAG TPA: hypothetical protein VF708_09310 [Pyrinomonadaceae bacterium]|jgi:hypothetical protein